MKKLFTVLLVAIVLILTTRLTYAQTPVPMSSQPSLTYTENFADITNWTNNFAAGTGANRWKSVGVNATGTIPDGTRTTVSSATFVTGTTGGMQRGTGTLVFLSTGSPQNTNSVAAEIFLDFSTVNAGTISFDWGRVDNSATDRAASLRVYTSTDGVTYTELTGAAVNNVVVTGGTASGSVTTVSLPTSFNNSSTARIRFYEFNGSINGTGGNRPKISIDNLTITATSGAAAPPTLTAAGSATVDAPFSVTFTDNPSWRAAITGITVGGVSLTAGYSTSTAGQIIFTPSASTPSGLLQTSGTNKSIIITATGFNNASVSQTILAGTPTKLGINTQPVAPASNGGTFATQPVIAIQDQYGNTTTSTASVVANLGAGSWTIGGTTSKAGVAGVATFTDLTATSPSSVTGATIDFTSTGLTHIESNAFNIPAPPLSYYSQGSLDITQLSSWNSARDGSGSAPSNFSNADAFIIQSGHSMTTSTTLTISGSGGRLEIEGGGTLTATNAVTISSGVTFQIDNGGTYNHNNTAVASTTIFAGTESFGASSTIVINSWSASGTAIPTATFGNLTINWDPGAAWNQSGSTNTINGNFTINNGSSSAFRFCGNTSTTVNIGGDLIVTSGLLQFNNASSGNTYVLNIGGSYNQTGGTFSPNTGTSTLAVNFSGTGKTFTQSAGTLTNTLINWTVNSGASLTLANDLLVATARTASIVGTLDLGSHNLTGAGTATLSGNGTIKLGGAGSSQISAFGTNSFSGTYEYTGSSQTISGTYANLKMNGSGLTLSGSVTLTGALTMTAGNLDLGNFNITTVDIIGGSSSSYIVTSGTGAITRTGLTNGGTETFPIGFSSYNPVTITNSSGPTEDFTAKVKNSFDHATADNTQAVQRQWDIAEGNVGGNTAVLTFQFATADEGSGLFSEDLLEVGHWNVGGYYDAIGSSPVGGSNPAFTITTDPVGSFSPFIIANEGIAPVELASFTSSLSGRNVNLTWATNSEENNSGFDVERKAAVENSSWTKVGNVAGNGTSNVSHSYNFSDRNLQTGNYSYRLKQIDNNGNFKYYALSNEVVIGVPTKFELSQNYPNPFNPSTKINYDLPVDAKVSIRIIDMTGREVANLLNGNQTAGSYTVNFNASSLSSGIYFYQINASGSGQNFVKTMKMLLVK